MKPAIAMRYSAVALAGALAGYGVMRAKSPAPPHASDPAAAAATHAEDRDTSASPKSQATDDSDAGPARHDLTSLLKWSKQRDTSGTPAARAMERLDNGELRSLLIELASETGANPQISAGTARLAAAELFKREGTEAFEWAEGLDPEMRKAIYPRILSAALATDAIAYKDRFDAYSKEFGDAAARDLVYPMIGGATERGAEDLIKLREAYGDALLKQFMFPMGSLPEDFDFHRFFTGMPALPGDGSFRTFQYWAAKDRDAAWSGLKEMMGEGTTGAGYLPSIFDGVAAVSSPGRAAEWLAPKLSELTDAQREKALNFFGVIEPLEAETLSTLIPLLDLDADRMKLAQRAVASSVRDSSAGVAALSALDSDQRRAEVLLNHVRTIGFEEMLPAFRDRRRGVLESLMDTVKLPQAMREQVTGEIERLSNSGGSGG